MENSLENIWKNGNHGSVENIDFYNRESELWFQKIFKYLKKDNLSLIPVGLIIVGLLVFYKEYLGAALAFVFISFLFLMNQNTIAKLKKINVSDKVIVHMKTNQQFIKKQKRNSIIFTGLIIPLFMIVELWAIFRDSDHYSTQIANSSSFKIITLIVIIYIAIGALGVTSYLVSTKTIYGKLLKRLDTIVSDFEKQNGQL